MNILITEKLTEFSQRIVPHPEYRLALETVLRSAETTKVRGEPASALLTGEPGTGKSTICRDAVRHFGEGQCITTQEGTVKTIPAFYCSLPAGSTIKTLTITMLRELGATQLSGDNVTLFSRLINLLKTRKTKFIVLDEFDNLLRKGAEKTREQVCDWVRTLLNESLVPVLLVGIPQCEDILNAHPQLSRRYPYRHRMNQFSYASIDPTSVLSKTLRSLGESLREIGEFDQCINLSGDQALTSMYLATGGNLNGIRQLLSEAFKSALVRGDGAFTIEDLAAANEISFIPTAKYRTRNPFQLSPADLKKVISGGKIK